MHPTDTKGDRTVPILIGVGALWGAASLAVSWLYLRAFPAETLYFISLLLGIAVSGFLAAYAWEHRSVTGATAFMLLEGSQGCLALAEGLTMLSPSAAQAQFWFNLRFIFAAGSPVLWLIFTLEYTGLKRWIAPRLIALMFVPPLITQAMVWSNLRGLWVARDIAFNFVGPYAIAITAAREPGIWFLAHVVYTLSLLLVGTVVILIAAWRRAHTQRAEALWLAAGAFIPFVAAAIPAFNLAPALPFNPFGLGSAVGAVLVAVAVFRTQFLAQEIVGAGAPQLATVDEQSARSALLFVFVFLLLAMGVTVGGFVYFQAYERQFRSQVESQLTAIADLQVTELVNLRSGWQEDAAALHQNPAFAALVQRALNQPAEAETQAQLQAWLETIRAHSYDQVTLLDSQAVEIMSAPPANAGVSPYLRLSAAAAIESQQITLLDFHRDTADDQIHLTILVPILAGAEPARPIAVVALRVDPTAFLYPFIQAWPGTSASAETVLVRREGDDALYLSDLKYRPNAALNLRVPLTDADLIAAQAVLGRRGIVAGHDYRRVPVVANVSAVPNSPWYLVEKVDTAEVFAPLRARAWEMVALFGALLLGSGAGLGAIWRRQRLRLFQARAQIAASLRRSEEKYRELVEQASDGIFIADARGQYVEVNRSGCAMLGYTREELLARHIVDIVDPDDLAATPLRLDELRRGKSILSERRLICSDGRRLPVEISARMFPDGRFQSIIRDISERRRAEADLRASEAKHRTVVNQASDGIAIAQDQRIQFANASLAAMLGYDLAEIEGHGFSMLIPPEAWAATLARYQQRLAGVPMPASYEAVLLHKQGRLIPVAVTANVIQYEGRSADLVVLRDITERKQAEAALAQYTARLEEAEEHAGLGSWEFDVTTGQGWWSKQMYRLFGLEVSGQVPSGEVYLERIHPADRALVRAVLSRMAQGEEPPCEEYRSNPQHGPLRHFAPTVALERDAQGAPLKFVGTLLDITERKRVAEALTQERALLRTLIDHLPDAIYIKDRASRFLVKNWADVRQMGAASPEETVGKTDFDYYAPALAAQYYADDQAVITSGQAIINREEPVTDAAGHAGWMTTTKVPLHDALGQVIGLVGIGHDITASKQAEAEIRRLNAELEQRVIQRTAQLEAANKELEAFTYSASHDLRAPLRAIGGYSKILVEEFGPALTADGLQMCIRIYHEAQRMGQLLDDLLAFSRLGRKEMLRAPTNMRAMVQSLIAELGTPDTQPRVDWQVGALPDATGDPAMLRQVWFNLLANALKFSAHRAPAVITVSGTDTATETIYGVRDNGAGFDMQFADRLFGVFQRLHSESEFEGTGVGLAIVQRVVGRHGGRVWGEGQVDHGAAFYFTLPRAAAAGA